MQVYIILFAWTMLLCAFADWKGYSADTGLSIVDGKLKISRKSFWTLLLIVVPLIVIDGCRYFIGTDFSSYVLIFQTAQTSDGNKYNMEWGYYLLNVILGKFFSYQSIFIVTAFLTIVQFTRGFIKSSGELMVNFATFLGLGYYFYSMNIMRQYLAISIVCMGYHYLEEKNYRKFVAYLIVAAFFHQSVLVWIPVVLLVKFVKGKIIYIASIILAVVMNFGEKYIIAFLAKYTSYAHFFTSNSSFIQSRRSLVNIIICGGVFAVTLMLEKRIALNHPSHVDRIKYVWIMLIIYVAFNSLGDSMIRVALNFFFVLVLSLSDCFDCFGKRLGRLAKLIYTGIMLATMCFLVSYSGNSSNHFLPYISVFNKLY